MLANVSFRFILHTSIPTLQCGKIYHYVTTADYFLLFYRGSAKTWNVDLTKFRLAQKCTRLEHFQFWICPWRRLPFFQLNSFPSFAKSYLLARPRAWSNTWPKYHVICSSYQSQAIYDTFHQTWTQMRWKFLWSWCLCCSQQVEVSRNMWQQCQEGDIYLCKETRHCQALLKSCSRLRAKNRLGPAATKMFKTCFVEYDDH